MRIIEILKKMWKQTRCSHEHKLVDEDDEGGQLWKCVKCGDEYLQERDIWTGS